jgi:hypothetical protein
VRLVAVVRATVRMVVVVVMLLGIRLAALVWFRRLAGLMGLVRVRLVRWIAFLRTLAFEAFKRAELLTLLRVRAFFLFYILIQNY